MSLELIPFSLLMMKMFIPLVSGVDPLELDPCHDRYKCSNGECIKWENVCNGINDCNDFSDEGGACSHTCGGMYKQCSQVCLKTSMGPKCACHEGFKLSEDGADCIDIEECKFDPPACVEKCHEEIGGFKCDCFKGLHVDPNDRTRCVSDGDPWVIYSTDWKARRIMRFYRFQANDIYYYHSEIFGIDVDIRNQNLYFTDEELGTINCLDLKNNSIRFERKVGRPRNIALDWISYNIYFVNVTSGMEMKREMSINVCNFDATNCAKIKDITRNWRVGAMAVDAVNEFLFYSEVLSDPPSSVIYKANLDGSELFAATAQGLVTGLAYDLNKYLLYYLDSNNDNGSIKYISYNGFRKGTLYKNLFAPLGLQFFEDRLYLGVPFSQMQECPLYRGNRSCLTYNVNPLDHRHFFIFQDSRQPNASNVCESNTCDYLCIPSTKSHWPGCICKDGEIVHREQKCPNNKLT